MRIFLVLKILHQMLGCELIRIDECRFGFVVGPDENLISQKGIGISANVPRLKVALKAKYLCDQRYLRWILQDGKSTHAARIYQKTNKTTINDYRQPPLPNRCCLASWKSILTSWHTTQESLVCGAEQTAYSADLLVAALLESATII